MLSQVLFVSGVLFVMTLLFGSVATWLSNREKLSGKKNDEASISEMLFPIAVALGVASFMAFVVWLVGVILSFFIQTPM